ncbi:ABC transporter substrate-binding protein [Poseidonocella sedimentorum]|uniref:Iron complex transport system substrate-binding protein n=1 Tax=Poseidonocella sedimentorum TaxID=871652 RepID=A0A1I6E4K8_9RHOB|nr:ABC transporter substrate-binding protein [Poseidonocella sedimentorum]SFR12482.1 iron complex transport system substrate-binding protein [Poseidonocella sedimentorum]
MTTPHRFGIGLRALALTLALLGWALPAAAELRITDVTEREVRLPEAAQAVILGDARHIMVLGMLLDDPVARVVGWRQDKGLDPARRAAFAARFPALEEIAPVGAGNRELSVEATIAQAPDLVILSLTDARNPTMEVQLLQLEAAGIPVVFVDFFSHPIENTTRSLEILGQALGAEDRAADLIAFYTERLDTVRGRLAEAQPDAPRVFVQVHAAPGTCCATVGGGVFHDFIEAAGGHNLGQDAVPGIMGNVGLENVIAADPDVFLATGGAHMRERGGLVLGAGVAQDEARAGLEALLSGAGIADLRAVELGQAHAFWHLFNDSPMHIALIEYLAQTFHPELFADLDPQATVAEMQARFSPIDVDGTWWLAAE